MANNGLRIPPQNTRFYGMVGLFLILLFLSYLVVKPYLITIMTALIVAMIVYPFHRSLQQRLQKPTLTALITTILVFLIIVIPASFFISALAQDAYAAYLNLQSTLAEDTAASLPCTEGVVCALTNQLRDLLLELKQQGAFAELGKTVRDLSLIYGGDILRFAVVFIFKIFVFVLVLFFLLRDGEQLIAFVKRILPLDEAHKKHFLEKTSETLYAVMYGVFLTALIQSIIATLLYAIAGLPSPLVLGFLTLLGALTIGAWIVWAPAGVITLLVGLMNSDTSIIIAGIVVLVVGAVISALDNILRPYFIGKRSKVHFAVIVVGLLGGLQLFGLVGIFVGPVILSLLIVALQLSAEK